MCRWFPLIRSCALAPNPNPQPWILLLIMSITGHCQQEQEYGHLSYLHHIVLGLNEVNHLVHTITKGLGTRLLTNPFPFPVFPPMSTLSEFVALLKRCSCQTFLLLIIHDCRCHVWLVQKEGDLQYLTNLKEQQAEKTRQEWQVHILFSLVSPLSLTPRPGHRVFSNWMVSVMMPLLTKLSKSLKPTLRRRRRKPSPSNHFRCVVPTLSFSDADLIFFPTF